MHQSFTLSAWSILLLALLALAGLVWLMARSKRRAVIGLVLLVPALALVGVVVALHFRAGAREQGLRMTAHGDLRAVQQQEYHPRQANAWNASPLEGRADTYPSMQAAAEGLARRVVEEDGAFADGRSGRRVQVQLVTGRESGPQAMGAFERALAAALPEVFFVRGGAAGSAVPEDAVRVEIDLATSRDGGTYRLEGADPRATAVEDSQGLERGTVSATVFSAAASSTYQARWSQKLWVDDFGRFLDRLPPDMRGGWVVGRTRSFAGSESDALREAYEAAADELFVSVWPVAQRNSPGHVSSEGVRQDLRQRVRQAPYQRDVFVQRIQRPYGDVYRAAVLVDASPEHVEQLAMQYGGAVARVDQMRRSYWFGRIGSVAGVVLLIFLVYLGLNALTRGYYHRRLKITAIVVGAVLLLALLLVA